MMPVLGKSMEEFSHVVSDETLKTLLITVQRISYISTLTTTERIEYAKSSEHSELELELSQKVCQGLDLNTYNNLVKIAGLNSGVEMNKYFALAYPYAHNTEMSLSFGGDDRLTLQMNNGGINKYFSSTIPRDDIVKRGSCTCSTISSTLFDIAHKLRIQMLEASLTGIPRAMSTNNGIRERIRNVLRLKDTKHSIITCPSGSDAEFLPLCAALVRRQKLLGNRIVTANIHVLNCVTAAGEVGSGTPNASGGRHFSPLSPKGTSQKDGESLFGLTDADKIKLLTFKPRAADGSVNFNDEEIFQTIRNTLLTSGAEDSVAVLHVVCSSKTGLVYPSIPGVMALQAELGPRLVVVMDCCQLRVAFDRIREFVDLGFICLITGSKFFAGPPFSGAVILPVSFAEEIEQHLQQHYQQEGDGDGRYSSSCKVPLGLADYLTPSEIPEEMSELRKFIVKANRWSEMGMGDINTNNINISTNAGLTLRWESALHNMERYAALPPDLVEDFAQTWVEQ
eukprot:gene4466-8895_t